MTLARFAAIIWMAEHPRAIIDVEWAKKLCDGVGIPWGALLYIDGEMVRRPRAETERDQTRRAGWLVRGRHLRHDLVQVSDVAVAMARFAGEYANEDQAKASQHGTTGRVAQYVCQRACVRLAFHFYGQSGHTDRYGDDPAVVRLVSEVPSIRTAGVRSKMKTPDGQPIIGFDGKPIWQGGDQILIEKVYKVNAPA